MERKTAIGGSTCQDNAKTQALGSELPHGD